MKKKLVISFTVILIASVVFSSTGLANAVKKKISATFGAYTVQLNGKNQKTETLYYNKKVYIPVNDVAKMTGSTVKQSKNTVNISVNDKIKRLKLMSEFQDTYYAIEQIADKIIDLPTGLGLGLDYYEQTGQTNRIAFINKNLTDDIKEYNNIIKRVESLAKRAKSEGYSDSSNNKLFGDSLNNLKASLDHTQKAYNNVVSYTETKNEAFYNGYMSETDKAFYPGVSGKDTARKGYEKYAKAIQNFK